MALIVGGALVHEWLSVHGGSENVVEAMSEVLPDATILTLWEDTPSRFTSHKVEESPMARSGWLRQQKALALPLMPLVWRSWDLSRFDWLMVSSHAFAHQVASNPTAAGVPVHVYVHTPARYIWFPELDDRGSKPWLTPMRRILARRDRARVGSSCSFAANSAFVANRIEKVWGKEARIIHPPADVERLQTGGPWRDRLSPHDRCTFDALPDFYVLGASRFVPYKQVDKAVAVGEMLDVPVVLAGAGPDISRLRQRAHDATVPVSIVELPSNELLSALMEQAALYVFAPVEDFGIMPVESMALGTPVLVNEVGGARESVEKITGGIAVDFEDVSAVRIAAKELIARQDQHLPVRSRSFGVAEFQRQVLEWQASAS